MYSKCTLYTLLIIPFGGCQNLNKRKQGMVSDVVDQYSRIEIKDDCNILE